MLVLRRFAILHAVLFSLLATTDLNAQAPTPDQRDLGVCPALRPALDGAGPNAGIADAKAARAALSSCAPGTVPTIIGTVMVLMAENNTAALRAEANRAVAIAPNDPYVLRMQCHVENTMRDYARAVDLCSQALSRRPDWDQALHYRGTALMNSGRNAEAVVDLERAVARNPRLPITWTSLFIARRALGEREKAAEALRRSLDITPNDAPRLFSMSEILSELGRHVEAEAMADRLLARRTTAPDYNRRGNARVAQRKHQLALADFQAAEAADPKAAYAVFNQGVVTKALRGCAGARPLYERAGRIDTTYAAPLWALVDCDPSDALKSRTLTELTRRDSMNAKAWLERGLWRSDSTKSQRDSSIRDFDRALRLDTADWGTARERARLHVLNGDDARALPDLRRVAQRTRLPQDVGRLAIVLEKSGQATEAITTLTTFDQNVQGTMQTTRIFLGLRGFVRLRAGDIDGARDVAEWLRHDSKPLDDDLRSDANTAYASARVGGITRARFETALAGIASTASHAHAARFMRLGMLVEEGDRRAAYTEFQALSSAPVTLRGYGGALIGRFLVQDIGAARAPVAFWNSGYDGCRDNSSLVCRKVLAVHPNGEVYVAVGQNFRDFTIMDYDPVNRRAKLLAEGGQVDLDLRDQARPVLNGLDYERSILRRCANDQACR